MVGYFAASGEVQNFNVSAVHGNSPKTAVRHIFAEAQVENFQGRNLFAEGRFQSKVWQVVTSGQIEAFQIGKTVDQFSQWFLQTESLDSFDAAFDQRRKQSRIWSLQVKSSFDASPNGFSVSSLSPSCWHLKDSIHGSILLCHCNSNLNNSYLIVFTMIVRYCLFM